MQKWKGIGSFHDTRLINVEGEDCLWILETCWKELGSDEEFKNVSKELIH